MGDLNCKKTRRYLVAVLLRDVWRRERKVTHSLNLCLITAYLLLNNTEPEHSTTTSKRNKNRQRQHLLTVTDMSYMATSLLSSSFSSSSSQCTRLQCTEHARAPTHTHTHTQPIIFGRKRFLFNLSIHQVKLL